MATKLVQLPHFMILLDRAGNVVVEKTNEIGNTERTIDFGTTGPVVVVIDAWLDLEVGERDALAPAINSLLLQEFASRA